MTQGVTRESPVTVLQGVGKVRADAYRKMGVLTLGDLISHYPRAYENRGNIVSLSESFPDRKSALILTVATEPKIVRLRNHRTFLKFRAFDESASCEIVFFNQDFLRTQFPIGSTFRFYGKVEKTGARFSLSSPAFEAWTESANLPPLFPVYPTTEGLSQKQIAKDIRTALDLLRGGNGDPMPSALLDKRNLCSRSFAERSIHLPTDWQSLGVARRRLVYDEFFYFSLGASVTQKRNKTFGAPECRMNDMTRLVSYLPYQLTSAQKRAIREILDDMEKPIPMSRMLVGDVGCGKTVCAAAAMLSAVQSGFQAAMMAPTEILARQHFDDLSPMFDSFGISCELLVGSTSAGEKKRIKSSLLKNETKIVIGTHALLTDDVTFFHLGLTVTDEQHRFGARQRAKLNEKSDHAHLLVMSATPIPRSLALILYGDLDLSKIDEMPAGRQRVDTYVVDETYRSRLNDFIRRQVADGGQAYVVCPAVEDDEDEGDVLLSEIGLYGSQNKSDIPLKAAVNFAEEMQSEFSDLKVAFLHGKMKSADKDRVMRDFSEQKIQILVSTTVIEVGVNVPNANLMIVENAERFGLSQLHQLRGRVGRGKRKSYCVLVMGQGAKGEKMRERLDVMRTTYDGFQIAEQDLEQRGPGDFLAANREGTVRQSGGFSFKLGDAGEDASIMADAATDAKELLNESPNLDDYPELRSDVEQLFYIEDGLFS